MSPLSHLAAVGFCTGRYKVAFCKCRGKERVFDSLSGFCTIIVCVVSGEANQKYRNIVDCHTINATLHGANQVMVKLRHVNCLVEHKVVYLPVSQMVDCKDPTDHLKCLQTLLWVIPNIFCIIRMPALSTVVSARESSSKLVSKGLLDDMLDIFKSDLVKRTVRNGAIHLDSRIGSFGVKSWLNIGSDANHLWHVVFFSWRTSAGLVVKFNQVEHLDETLLSSWSPKRSLLSSESPPVMSSQCNKAATLRLGAGDFVQC
jgi:hypothetical protein